MATDSGSISRGSYDSRGFSVAVGYTVTTDAANNRSFVDMTLRLFSTNNDFSDWTLSREIIVNSGGGNVDVLNAPNQQFTIGKNSNIVVGTITNRSTTHDANGEKYWDVYAIVDAVTDAFFVPNNTRAPISGTSRITFPNIYTISFNANGGSVSPSSTRSAHGDLITLPTPSRSGYTFDGWFDGGSFVGGAGSSYTTTSTTTLTANWTIDTPAPVWSDGVINYGIVRVGQSFSDRLQASDTTSYSLIEAPSGLYVQDYGSYAYIFGTVNATSSGTDTIRVRATGPGGSTDDSDTFTIRQALPSWTNDNLPDGKVGQSYNGSISANNTSYWIINESISGISVTDNSGTTASLTGNPTSFGNYTVSATPYNSDNESGGTRNISVTIEDSDISWVDNTLSTTTIVEGQTYSDGVSATGSDNISYSVSSGSLPTGITLNTSTGAITGTPTVPDTYTFSIRASNGDGSSVTPDSNLSITVEVAGGFMKVWNGSAWEEISAQVWDGSVWVEGTVKVWNGSAWVESFSS